VRRILFAWELGANFGHLARNLAVARPLRAAGHEVLFAVRDTRTAEELLAPDGFGFVQAPSAPGLRSGKPQVSYADVLAVHGFDDAHSLLGRVRAWASLYELLQPDVIVIDHAPTALLAGRLRGLSMILLGSGFDVPPLVTPVPPIRLWETTPEEALVAAEARVVATINRALDGSTARPITRLVDIFAGVPIMRATFPELDHYGTQSGVTYVGSIGLNSSNAAQQVAWPRTRGLPRVLAYLRMSLPCLPNLLDALAKFPAEVICVVPGCTPAMAERHRAPRLRIFDRALRLPELLPDTDLMISYGGTATVAGSLLAGVPLLLASQAVEQQMVAMRVGALGAGVVMNLERKTGDFLRALAEATGNPRYKAAARKFAKQYSTFHQEQAVERVMVAIRQAAAGRGLECCA